MYVPGCFNKCFTIQLYLATNNKFTIDVVGAQSDVVLTNVFSAIHLYLATNNNFPILNKCTIASYWLPVLTIIGKAKR